MKPSLELSELQEKIADIDVEIRKLQPTPEVKAVGFFDLSGSTSLKLQKGHSAGAEAAMRFIALSTYVVRHFDGVIVKETGDGVLCYFTDPLGACRAALNLKAAADSVGLPATFGLTLGRVSRYQTSLGTEDLLGDAVDRCSRIQGLANSGQVLVDGAMHEIVKSHLKDFRDILVGREFRADAKGVGTIDLWEISLRNLGLVGNVATPLTIHARGRLSIDEKVQFMSLAQTEILEIGIGLTSFARYFTGQKPDEFQRPIRELIKNGVAVRCYALDLSYVPGRVYLAEQGDEDYERDMERARQALLEEGKNCRRSGYAGSVEYLTYRQIPEFHCLGVDVDDQVNGRILLSPYLPGLSRAACPVYQVSRTSDRELYEKYLTAINAIRESSEETE